MSVNWRETSDFKDFLNDYIPEYLLEDIIFWINSNLAPEDVFEKTYLDQWAENNDYIKEE